MARKIADVLLQLFVLGITGFLLLVFVDLRDRYDQKITAPDSNRIDGRNLALMPGLPSHPDAGAEHARHAAGRSGGLTPSEDLAGIGKTGQHRRCGKRQSRHVGGIICGREYRYRRRAWPEQCRSRPLAFSEALPGRHGYSFAAVVCGHSRAVNWLARPTHLEGGCFPKVPPWRSPLMATPLSWADLATIGPPVPPGCSSAAAVLGSSKATSWSAPAVIA